MKKLAAILMRAGDELVARVRRSAAFMPLQRVTSGGVRIEGVAGEHRPLKRNECRAPQWPCLLAVVLGIAFTALTASCGKVGAATNPPPSPPTRPTPQAAPAPKIQFDKIVYDAGKVVEGSTVSGSFSFLNAGDAVLEVTNVETSCGCTVASVKPDKLKPGEKGDIIFTLDLLNTRGPAEKHITVPSNDPQNPQTDLTIKVDVTPVFELDPQLVFFGGVSPGRTVRGEVYIKRLDGKKLVITEVVKDKDYITTKIVPDEKSDGLAATLVVEAKPTGAPGTFSDMLNIYVTNVPKPSLVIPVAGQLLGGIILEPEALVWNIPDPAHFPGPNPDVTTVRSVLVSSDLPDHPLEVHDFGSDFDDLLVKVVPVEKGKKFKVLLKLDQPLKESAEGVLTFETNLRTQPTVEVPLKFNVAKP